MEALRCPQCGAPASSAAGDDGLYTCPFCKQTSRIAPPRAAAPQFVIVQQSIPPPPPSFAPTSDRDVARPSRVLPLLPALLPIVILAFVFRQPLQNLTGVGAWDGSEPLVCGGVEEIAVSGVSAKFTQGSAVIARDNCHVTLKNCKLSAPVAIVASGNARVTVIGGGVEGATAVEANDNAAVALLANVTTTGLTKRSKNASVTGK